MAGAGGLLLVVLSGIIFIVQLIRLIARTTIIHGVIAFLFLSVSTLGVFIAIVLAIAAACDSKSSRVVIIP